MEGVIALILAVVIFSAIGLFLYAYYLQAGLTQTDINIANAAYQNLVSFLNVSKSTVYACTPTIPAFSVYSSGIVAINSQVSNSKAVSYTGGIPAKGVIYYASNKFFTISPFPIVPGNYTNSKICIIPSAKTFQITT
ncbi:MAG: hypothetical protein QXV17_05400 [Candidatus Micrarchaeaceae archaeon]